MAIQNILIEGIDGAGKSTLAKELRNRLGWDGRTLGHAYGNQYKRYLREYQSLRHTIIERGHMSELAYSRLFGRPSPLSAQEKRQLDAIVRADMLTIFADPSLEQAIARVGSRNHVFQLVDDALVSQGKQVFAAVVASCQLGSGMLVYHARDFDDMERLISIISQRLSAQP